MAGRGKRSNQSRGGRPGRFVREFDRDPDPYLAKRKISGPAACPECGAAYVNGRWVWQEVPSDAKDHLCPACQRVHDNVPGGYVTLRGGYVATHESEIMNLVTNVEERERKEHPLKRLMETEKRDGDTVITVTDAHLARAIGEALHHAHQGELDIQYTKDDAVARVYWSRSE